MSCNITNNYIGYVPSDPKANKTDFLLDVTSGKWPCTLAPVLSHEGAEGDEALNGGAASPKWHLLWQKHGEKFLSDFKTGDDDTVRS